MAEPLGLAASVIAVIDLSAKVVSRCSEYYTNVKNAPDDIERLQREARGLQATLNRVQSLCDGPTGIKLQESFSLREGIEHCHKQLVQLETKLEPRTTNKLMSRFGMRALIWPLKSKEVDGIMKKLKSCKDNISFSLQVDQEEQILNIHQKFILAKLRTADNAAFDSHDEEHHARCYQGTRVELLEQIDSWANNSGSERIFWLNGMAGTGKSTISRTVAQDFANKGNLGASFFFKRGEGDRGHASLLITTIATQLVQKLPSLAPHVQHAIEADPRISSKALKQQFDTLVLQPLGKMQINAERSSSIVVVIDALDECDSKDDVRTIIGLFSQVKHITTIELKFFLTSRPELPIRLGFEDIRGKYDGLALHQFPEPIVKEDISAFLEHELAMIREDYNKTVTQDRQLPAEWPSLTNVQSLVGMSVPLFIFATTVCRFIKDRKCGQPKDQLAKVLKYETRSQSSKLDATYLPVLDQLLVGVTASERRGIVKEFQQVVGSIVILASPLSASSLDRLLGVTEGTVDDKIDLLHSVLSIPSRPDHPIRLLHLSFRDFLVDTEKRETNPFWVNEKNAHSNLANQCLKLLSTGDNLKKDICNLRTIEKPRADVSQQTINSHLPPAVQYACQYWVYHLKESRSIICDDDQVHRFLKHHFLNWLEALSFIGRMRESIGMVNDLMAMIEPIQSIQMSKFLHDAKRFILNYGSIVDLSPLQLYSSALVFAPKNSIIRNTFQNYIPDWISQQPNLDLEWDAVLQTLEGHSGYVYSVAFSHDSKLLASASDDQTVKVWNVATDTLQQTLEGHNGYVYSVAFSHNSKLLASASDDTTVIVWDVASGTLQQTLEGHSGWVHSVAFSHDSKLLASASDDTTVKVWDVAIGTLQYTLEGHSGCVYSVAFSHDSRLLASASDDTTVKVWEVTSGTLQQTLEGHSGWVYSVAFSHDSKLLASAADDTTVKVWDVATGALQYTLEGHGGYVYSVAFSRDSRLLASASEDRTVKVWEVTSGALQQTLEGHTRWVRCVAFSHNSKLLASASDDKTVKIWDIALGILPQKLQRHNDWVHSVAFSHDSKLLASASDDTTVKVWDVATGTLQQTFEGHSSCVYSIAFSHDSKLLASASGDKTIKVWNVATGMPQQTLEGHRGCVRSVAFSHDSKLLASASDDTTVKVWDVALGILQQTLAGHSGWICSVAFSHDSKLLASASDDTIVKVWDVALGMLRLTLTEHSGWARSVAFSHDSKLLASASNDKTVKVWDVASGMLQHTLAADGSISTLSFDITNSVLITNSGGIKLYKAGIPSLAVSSQQAGGKTEREGLGIVGPWVMCNDRKLLWLPPSFRAVSSNISQTGSTLGIGCSSGKVIIIAISIDTLCSYYI